jgi:hypothetical protein
VGKLPKKLGFFLSADNMDLLCQNHQDSLDRLVFVSNNRGMAPAWNWRNGHLHTCECPKAG